MEKARETVIGRKGWHPPSAGSGGRRYVWHCPLDAAHPRPVLVVLIDPFGWNRTPEDAIFAELQHARG